MSVEILPSLLAANPLRLEQEISEILAAKADGVHLDVMDQHYVPNLSFGADFCRAIRTTFPNTLIDVHLMVSPVDAVIRDFEAAGANRIAIHPDATIHLDRSLSLIRDAGLQAGLVLNPATSPESLRWCAHHLDFVLLMSVNPGFGGQQFIPNVLDKISWVHEHYPNLAIAVDGGVTEHNIAELKTRGASRFIMGSDIFKARHYADKIQQLRDVLR